MGERERRAITHTPIGVARGTKQIRQHSRRRELAERMSGRCANSGVDIVKHHLQHLDRSLPGRTAQRPRDRDAHVHRLVHSELRYHVEHRGQLERTRQFHPIRERTRRGAR